MQEHFSNFQEYLNHNRFEPLLVGFQATSMPKKHGMDEIASDFAEMSFVSLVNSGQNSNHLTVQARSSITASVI